jgi:hypothetical protein
MIFAGSQNFSLDSLAISEKETKTSLYLLLILSISSQFIGPTGLPAP